MERRLVLATGPAGSTSSSFATVIGKLGFRVPGPRIAGGAGTMSRDAQPRWAARFHGRLLREADALETDTRPASFRAAQSLPDERDEEQLRAWLSDQFESKEHVVVNGEGLAWFLPLWQRAAHELGADLGLVLMLRHPLDCLSEDPSLRQEPAQATSHVATWTNVMLHLEHRSRGLRRSLVRTEDLHGDWAHTIATTCEDLGLPLLDTATTGQIRSANLALSAQPRGAAVDGWGELGIHPLLCELAERVWVDLVELQSMGDSASVRARLDQDLHDYERLSEMGEGLATSAIEVARRRAAAAERRNQEEVDGAVVEVEDPAAARVFRALPHGLRRRIPVGWRRTILRMFTRRMG